MPYQGELLVGVTFVRSNRRGAGSAPGSEAPSGEPPTAIVKFLARETGEAVAVAEQLARSPFTVGGKLGAAQNVKNVAAEVSIGAEKTILAVAVQ
jgi:hypothetical protein